MKRLSKRSGESYLHLKDLTNEQTMEKIENRFLEMVSDLGSTDFNSYNDVAMDFVYDGTIPVEKFKK